MPMSILCDTNGSPFDNNRACCRRFRYSVGAPGGTCSVWQCRDLVYCSIMNCSSPLRDCDTPDECFISSTCLKVCDKPPISSRAIIFSADRLCILGGFENRECQRMKINSTRVEKSLIDCLLCSRACERT